MKKPPERIYLQDYGSLEPTWCSHRVNDDDVEYVRTDLLPCPICDQMTGYKCSEHEQREGKEK